MKYNLDITLMNPETYKTNKIKLQAEFGKSSRQNEYGNGMYLCIKGRGRTQFDKLFDIRYEKVDTKNLELFLLNWAYNYWSGENGSWDIISLTINNIEACNMVTNQ